MIDDQSTGIYQSYYSQDGEYRPESSFHVHNCKFLKIDQNNAGIDHHDDPKDGQYSAESSFQFHGYVVFLIDAFLKNKLHTNN
jgi:hypothetical protein